MTSTNSERTPGWRRGLSLLGAFVLGAVLLVGAWGKSLDPLAFAEQIRAEGLDVWLPAEGVVYVALALEIGLGTALLLGVRRLYVLVPSALLVLFFLFLTGRAYYRSLLGIEETATGCGCFGNLVERTPAEAFWQDLALLLPALLLTFLALGPKQLPRRRLLLTLVVVLVGLGFAYRAPHLPLDDLATRLSPGVVADDLCTGRDEERICLLSLLPELETGEHLVVIADLTDPSFGAAVTALNGYALEGESLFVLSAASAEEHHAFFWQWGPAFEIREAPEGLLRPLYRTQPRSFRVGDGVVVETYSGLPPLPSTPVPEATGG